MYEEANTKSGITIGFSLPSLGFITWLVFLILKVTGTWDIDWFWVWFPFWLPWAIVVAVFLIIIPICAIIVASDR